MLIEPVSDRMLSKLAPIPPLDLVKLYVAGTPLIVPWKSRRSLHRWKSGLMMGFWRIKPTILQKSMWQSRCRRMKFRRNKTQPIRKSVSIGWAHTFWSVFGNTAVNNLKTCFRPLAVVCRAYQAYAYLCSAVVYCHFTKFIPPKRIDKMESVDIQYSYVCAFIWVNLLIIVFHCTLCYMYSYLFIGESERKPFMFTTRTDAFRHLFNLNLLMCTEIGQNGLIGCCCCCFGCNDMKTKKSLITKTNELLTEYWHLCALHLWIRLFRLRLSFIR